MKITVNLSDRAADALQLITARYGVTQKSVIEAALIVYADGRRSPKLKELKTPEAKLRAIRAILDGPVAADADDNVDEADE